MVINKIKGQSVEKRLLLLYGTLYMVLNNYLPICCVLGILYLILGFLSYTVLYMYVVYLTCLSIGNSQVLQCVLFEFFY